jgi:hypothetical protein
MITMIILAKATKQFLVYLTLRVYANVIQELLFMVFRRTTVVSNFHYEIKLVQKYLSKWVLMQINIVIILTFKPRFFQCRHYQLSLLFVSFDLLVTLRTMGRIYGQLKSSLSSSIFTFSIPQPS